MILKAIRKGTKPNESEFERQLITSARVLKLSRTRTLRLAMANFYASVMTSLTGTRAEKSIVFECSNLSCLEKCDTNTCNKCGFPALPEKSEGFP